MNEELVKKAKEAKTVEELLALAKENSIELTEEQAKACFDQLHSTSGELSDDELDDVAGGFSFLFFGRAQTLPFKSGKPVASDLVHRTTEEDKPEVLYL